jgi:mRNA interferase HicA
MKLFYFIKHLREYNCELLREGGNHSWWINPVLSVPRHKEISNQLANKICKDLGIPSLK